MRQSLKEKVSTDTWRVRREKLTNAGFKSYDEFLASDFWFMVKQKQQEKDRYHLRECFLCSSPNVELHHKTYRHLTDDKNSLRSIRAYCRIHHQQIHDLSTEKNISVSRATKLICKEWKKRNIFAFQRRLISGNPKLDWSKVLKGRPVNAI